MVLVGSAAASPYRLKTSPYSSHSLLLACLPARGDGRRVLDIGCGPGYLGQLIASRGFEVTGIEREAAPDFPSSVRLIRWDFDCGFPTVPQSYDYVICADILEHLKNPADLLRAARGVLTPGGTLLASLPNSGHLYFRWNVMLGRFPQHDKGLFDRTHLRFYTWTGWRALFAEAGWRIESLHSAGVPAGLALPRWEGTIPVRLLERISFESARAWKTLFAYQFIVAAHLEPA
jgi:SAM-dependent methyltransferase